MKLKEMDRGGIVQYQDQKFWGKGVGLKRDGREE